MLSSSSRGGMSLIRRSWLSRVTDVVVALSIGFATANAQLTAFTDEICSSIEASWRDLSPPEPRLPDGRFLEIRFLEHPLPLTAKWLLDSHRMVDYVLPAAI